ncbi:hypothetical protein HK102_004190 [Quaeritorhiza haematococci]|nr:hypothetical protein HK102_004190 [Quaeritorhiza haematococci]
MFRFLTFVLDAFIAEYVSEEFAGDMNDSDETLEDEIAKMDIKDGVVIASADDNDAGRRHNLALDTSRQPSITATTSDLPFHSDRQRPTRASELSEQRRELHQQLEEAHSSILLQLIPTFFEYLTFVLDVFTAIASKLLLFKNQYRSSRAFKLPEQRRELQQQLNEAHTSMIPQLRPKMFGYLTFVLDRHHQQTAALQRSIPLLSLRALRTRTETQTTTNPTHSTYDNQQQNYARSSPPSYVAIPKEIAGNFDDPEEIVDKNEDTELENKLAIMSADNDGVGSTDDVFFYAKELEHIEMKPKLYSLRTPAPKTSRQPTITPSDLPIHGDWQRSQSSRASELCEQTGELQLPTQCRENPQSWQTAVIALRKKMERYAGGNMAGLNFRRMSCYHAEEELTKLLNEADAEQAALQQQVYDSFSLEQELVTLRAEHSGCMEAQRKVEYEKEDLVQSLRSIKDEKEGLLSQVQNYDLLARTRQQEKAEFESTVTHVRRELEEQHIASEQMKREHQKMVQELDKNLKKSVKDCIKRMQF